MEVGWLYFQVIHIFNLQVIHHLWPLVEVEKIYYLEVEKMYYLEVEKMYYLEVGCLYYLEVEKI